MAEVHNQLGDDDATPEGMYRYAFSGMAPDSYEHLPAIGEERVMQVIVRCTAHEDKETANEGLRRTAKLKVVNAEIGTLSERTPEDPTLFGDSDDDEPRADYGDYNPGSGEDFVPPAGDLLADERDGRAPAGIFSDGA
ncbi:hypothetical protein TPB0596_11980 [Tsukamurella pulmonis]|uniref:DUF7171 family protein n=1 Tax=Tsukamurella pulmonis TaxID=47312 RepID=UPI001EE05F0A|nr:hypothetical protein [Tsukamurella pulmonis]BDD81435.1 hypothetical protein TPB0596_11980 [Tsukamurella pulmonis]